MPTCANAASLQSRMSDVSGSIKKTASGSDAKMALQSVGEDDIFLFFKDQVNTYFALAKPQSKIGIAAPPKKYQF
jgi:hypothetical protein